MGSPDAYGQAYEAPIDCLVISYEPSQTLEGESLVCRDQTNRGSRLS